MKDTVDIDSLLDEINSISSTNNNKGKPKNKKKEDVISKPITTNQIVQTFEVIKLGDPSKKEQNIQEIINTDIEKETEEESVVQVLDTDAKKKKKKKKKKPTQDTKVDGEKDVIKEVEENINKYKQCFDFSDKVITNSRFQDNSNFRVLKNWEEKPWNQTYELNSLFINLLEIIPQNLLKNSTKISNFRLVR